MSDNTAVDEFAAAMKVKLAVKRAQGYDGWDNPAVCSVAYLREQLERHVHKGDPVDVANFAMMVWHRERRAQTTGGER